MSPSPSSLSAASPWLGLAVCLLLVPLSGCTSTETGATELDPGEETLAYRYEGPRGEEMRVQVEDYDHRYDASLTPRPAYVLNVSVAGLDPPEAFWFQEAVDEDGAVVQQFVSCESPSDDTGGCSGVQRGVLDFGAQGYPGAFGAGPFWGGDLPEPGTHRFPAPWFSGTEEIAFNVTRSSEGCVDVTGPSWSEVTNVPPFQLAVLGGPVTLCEDEAFPQSFRTVDGTSWSLVETVEADAPVVAEDLGPPPEALGPVSQRDVEFPLVVADPSDPSPFGVGRAHEEALERSEAYASLFERPGALLVGAIYYDDRDDADGLVDRDERTLYAVAPDGSGVKVTIERDRWVGDQATYEVGEEIGFEREEPPSEAAIASTPVEIGPAVERAGLLTGEPRTDTNWLQSKSKMHRYGWTAENIWTRQTGYVVLSLHEDPNPRGSGGFVIRIPYMAIIDGATGTVIQSTLTWDRLPWHEAISGEAG